MPNKYLLLSILIITSVFLSGCIFDSNNDKTIEPDFIPKTNLPPGFTFMGIHETTIDIANNTVSGFEGVYRYDGADIYIIALKSDNPEALLSQHKAEIKQKFREEYNPFEEIILNGHAATKLSDIMILNGKEEKRYSIIWTRGGYMIQVGSSSDSLIAFSLASSTGY